MITPIEVYNQINKLTTEIIGVGLCDKQNFPNTNTVGDYFSIGVSGEKTTIFLKNVSYIEMYDELDRLNAYNLRMLDGALITMQYRFNKNQLETHRLTFFPSPRLLEFQNEPELYLEDDCLADAVDKRSVIVPIRFDYDSNPEVVKCKEHPISHLTLGQYINCRIPVCAGITPCRFLRFIVMNFYHTAYMKYEDKLTIWKESFVESINDEEKEMMHLHTAFV